MAAWGFAEVELSDAQSMKDVKLVLHSGSYGSSRHMEGIH